MIKSGDICHGIISSLVILNAIDLMYQKNNFNRIQFKNDIIPACSAIYIHDLPKCFTEVKIERSKAPLAFLLKLSDCLQDWERPYYNNPTGFAATLFDIDIRDERLIFYARISDYKKHKIRSEISLALECQDVQIC